MAEMPHCAECETMNGHDRRDPSVLFASSAAALEKAREELLAAEELLEEAKAKLQRVPLLFLLEAGGDPELVRAAIRYLYWEAPDVHVSSIGGPLWLKEIQVRELAGQGVFSMPCTECGGPIPLKSRTHACELGKRYEKEGRKAVICDECYEKRRAAWGRACEAERLARERRLRELATMPYHEYLQTPEWKERKERHLKRVGYRCQICNASGVTLHVHHRTYERRGNERYEDLIVLCESCHRLFHFGPGAVISNVGDS